MARTFQVSFKINGAMDGSLQAALQAAANAMRGLGNAARQASAAAQASRGGLAGLAAGLNQLQQAAQRYKQVQDALKQTTADMSKASQNLRSAREKYAADTAAVEKLKAKLQELKTAQAELGTKKSAGNASLKQLRQDLQGLKQAYAEAKRAGDQMKMSQLGSQIKSTQGAITSQQEAVRKAAQAYKELSDKVKQTKADLQAAQAAQTASGRGLSSAQADAQRLAASYKSQQAALNALKASLSAAGFNTSNFAASESRLAADIDRVNAALRQQQALSSAQANSNAASQNLTMAGANFMGAIATAQQIATPFQSAIDNAMTFEHEMSRVKALTQTGNIMAGNLAPVEAEMAKLESQARQLGATTQFTMTQAAEAMGYLGMAGWKTEQIYGTMPGMLNLAAGAGTDLGRTADIVSDNMTAMGVPVEKAGHFMDVYAYALTNANVNLESLGATMKYAAPVAAAFGASLEDTAAMAMMMGNAGIKDTMAGTALRMGLLRLSGPPKKASKALDEMGISISDATAMAMEAEAELARLGVQYDKNAPPMEKMGTIITQLSGKMANMTAEEKLSSVSAIFGVNAASGWINILEQGPEVFNKYLNALRNCDGYSEQFAKTMNDDTRGAMIALESAMDAVQNSIGTALLPAVRAAAEAFTPIASAIAIFIQEHPGVVQAAAAIAAALTTIVVGAAAVKLAFAGWTFITSTVALVQTALASLGSGAMLGGLIARITALRTAMLSLTAAGGLATTGGWATMFTAISTKAAAAATAIRTFFTSLTLGSAASGVATTLSSIGTAIAGAARAAMAFAFSPVGVALMALGLAGMYVYQNWDRVGPVFSNIAGIITGALGPAITQIQAAFSALSSSGAFSSLTSAASQLASVVGGTLVKAFAVLATVVASALAVAIRAIADFVTFASEAFTGVLDVFGKLSEGDFSGAWEAWQSHGSKAIENIKNLGSHVFDGVEQGAKNVQQTLDALNAPKMPTQEVTARHAVQFDEGGVAHSAPAPEAQPIDTSATQAALDQVGNSAQNAATNMDGVNQATQQISQAGADVQQFGAGMQTASTGVQQFGTAAQTSTSAVQQDASAMQSHSSALAANGAALQGNIGALDAFGAAASGACGGVEALSSAASSAAGSLGGLGSAVQAACAALASAGASAAAAKNAKGGIYKKGAFLTTFAEESPEAAIPLDKSQRAIDLWTQAGQMLGQLPGKGGVNYEQARKFEDAIKEYNKNPKDLGTLNKTLDTHAQVFGGSRGGQARYVQSRRRAAMRQMPQTLPQSQGEMSDEVRKKVANLDRLIKAADYLPDTESNRRGKADLIRMREEYLRQQGFGGGRRLMPTLPQPSTARRSAYVARSRQSQVPMITAPPFNPDRPLTPNQPPLITTPPFAPTNQRGALEGLTGGLGRQMSFGSSSPITFTINVTVNGNANADEVKRGVEQAIPSLEDFAQKIQSLKHEAARRSFA